MAQPLTWGHTPIPETGFGLITQESPAERLGECQGYNEFSTKQLEKDFGNAAYATIRGFVLKFAEFGILDKARYGARVRYRVK